MCVGACVCICLTTPLSKAHVGAEIFCREGALANYMDLHPQWRSMGTVGTEGSEGATADQDIPESWGWMDLSDSDFREKAAEAHLVAIREEF